LFLSALAGPAFETEASDVVDPALSKPHCRVIRVHAIAIGSLEDSDEIVVDSVDH
jgi:hypothetical protein